MPYISSFMYYKVDGEQNREILEFISPDFIPGNYSFNAYFPIVGFEVEEEYTLRLEFEDSYGTLLFSTGEQNLEKSKIDRQSPFENQWGLIIDFEYKNVPFKHEGLYVTKVYANNKKLGEFAIPVYRGGDIDE
ncbi:hypothetical protein [Bacillus altitudinis]|uniref:hypothetical protein n=1 Tax=Bacillus altitudinis TaxID=293387 RepID=UPI003F7C35EF